MTPDEILRDALDKIRTSLGVDCARLGNLRAEETELKARIAKAEAAESVLLAAMGERPAAPASVGLASSTPSAGAEPAAAVKVAAPVPATSDPEPKGTAEVPEPRPSNFRPVEPKVAAAAIATVAPAATPAPKPQPVPTAGLPGPADPGRDKVIQAAKAESPSTRSERHVCILAAAGVVRAFGTQAKATAARFGVHGAELAPSMLRKIGITEQEVVAVAKALGAKKGAPEKAAAAEPEPAPEPAASLRDLADDLLNDLPTMLSTSPAGVGATTIADWFGCTVEQAKEAASLLIREGKASAPNKLLRLPAGEAVPA